MFQGHHSTIPPLLHSTRNNLIRWRTITIGPGTKGRCSLSSYCCPNSEWKIPRKSKVENIYWGGCNSLLRMTNVNNTSKQQKRGGCWIERGWCICWAIQMIYMWCTTDEIRCVPSYLFRSLCSISTTPLFLFFVSLVALSVVAALLSCSSSSDCTCTTNILQQLIVAQQSWRASPRVRGAASHGEKELKKPR